MTVGVTAPGGAVIGEIRPPAASRRPLIGARGIRIALGGIWLIDGLLQLQPYMFGTGFLRDMIGQNAQGQPWPIHDTIVQAVGIALPHRVALNVVFAVIQLLLALGIIISPRTARPAILLSIVWALIVWWAGEGFGMLFMGTASPLTGAPGAVILYPLVGLVAWPAASADGSGPLGERGRAAVWVVLWLLCAGLMLLPINRTPDAFTFTFAAAAAFLGRGWPLSGLDDVLARASTGLGLPLAVASAVIMAMVGLLVLADRWRNSALVAGGLIAIALWLTAEYLGGITLGSGTDPNTGPLIVLLALALLRRPRAAVPGPGVSLRSHGLG